MSEQFDVILGGLDTEVDVTIADSTGVDPSVLLALRGEKGDTGAAGQDGADGADGADGFSPTATVTKSGDTATITITDKDGTTTATVKDGTQANAFVAEFNVTTYADVKDAYDNDAILICTADDSGNTKIFQLAYFDDGNSIFYFAEPMGDGWDIASVSENDGWDNGIISFASTDVATQLRDGLMSALDKQKLDGIASGAEVNVQSDWNQSVNTADDYIKNKPTIPSNVSDLVNDSGFITSPNVVYCTCSTASGTAAKVATIESGSLTSLNEGDQAIVKFTNANGKANPTLKIGTTDAKSIMRYGTTAPSTSAASSWNAGSCVLFTYDGTYWQMANYLNTTYSEISEANITNGSGSSSGLVTGRRAKKAVETFAPVKDVTVDGVSVVTGGVAAIDLTGKQDELVSEVNIRTINGTSVLGSGDISVSASGTPIPTADTVAEFDSDAHINSDDMSAQDVEDFVDGLNAQGANLGDYVVEQGTDGVWTYRKWSSGIAECWRDWASASFAPATAVGGFYGRVLAASNFPTNLFIERPVAFFNLDEWGSGYFWGQARSVTASTYQVTVWRNDNASSSAKGSMYAIGKWK